MMAGDTGIVVLARWQVDATALDDVLALLPDLRRASLAEPGCLGYEVFRSVDAAHVLLLVERYRDQAAIDAHRASPHYRDVVVARIVPRLLQRQVEILGAHPE